MYSKFIVWILLLSSTFVFAEENFILVDIISNEKIVEMGPRVHERMSPRSTFKVALSLMGFDSGILKDTTQPVWLFQEGYDDFLEVWKEPQNPHSWIKNSCIWYSKIIAAQLGEDDFKEYLSKFNYGDQDATGGHTEAWLNSLKISPNEQVIFIQNMVKGHLPVSQHALKMTKEILFLEDLPNGWKLFGKTGWSGSKVKIDGKNELGWFVGWIEKGDHIFTFAYNIIATSLNLSQRIPRVKQLLKESQVMMYE